MEHQQQITPLVSVIVPVYNDPERIGLCIEALLGQTYPRDRYDILIVDNGSTDTTRAVIERYPVTLLVEDEQQSSYAARNKGLAHARGEIIAFTDSDCIPASDWLASGVAHLTAMPHIGLVGGKIDVFFKDPNHPVAAELYDRVTAFPQHDFIETEHFGATANVFTFRHMFDRVGLFNDTLKSSGDREWGNRVFAAGYPLVYADDTCVAHPARDSLGELYKKAIRVMEGQYHLKQKDNRSVIRLVKGIAWEFTPRREILMQIYTDKRIERYDQKLKTVAVLFSIMLLRAWARLQLYRTQGKPGQSAPSVDRSAYKVVQMRSAALFIRALAVIVFLLCGTILFYRFLDLGAGVVKSFARSTTSEPTADATLCNTRVRSDCSFGGVTPKAAAQTNQDSQKKADITVVGITDGQIISSTVAIQALVPYQDIDRVKFTLDGPIQIVRVQRDAPYAFMGDRNGEIYVWDTTKVPNGDYSLSVIAYNSEEGSITKRIRFRVDNPPTPVILDVTDVANGQIVSGTLPIQAFVAGQNMERVEFSLDGPVQRAEVQRDAPYAFMGDKDGLVYGWDTTEAPNGDYSLVVTAYNLEGRSTTEQIQFRVDNPQLPVITRIAGVSNGQTLSDTVVIQAFVSGHNVRNVLFNLSGPQELTHVEKNPPYVFGGNRDGVIDGWDTTEVPNGDYSLVVSAYDSEGRSTTEQIQFRVDNVQPPVITRIAGVRNGQTLSDTVVIQAFVSGHSVDRVLFDLSGPRALTHVEKNPPYIFGHNRASVIDGLDTTQLPDGNYTLRVTAYSADLQSASVTLHFRIDNQQQLTEPGLHPTPTVSNHPPIPTPSGKSGPIYYVSRNGTNGDGRSWATAWNELKNINWSVIPPGATILLDGGTGSMTYHSTLTVGTSGTQRAPIRILRASEAGRNGQVIIDGGRATALPYCTQPAASWTTSTDGVRKTGIQIATSWVSIDGGGWRGIKIQRHNLSGIYLAPGAASVTVRNVEITDNGFARLLNGSWTTDGAGIKLTGTNLTIEHAIVYDNGQDAIQSASTNTGIANLTVRESWFYNSAHPLFGDKWGRNSHQDGDSCAHSDGIQIYNGGQQRGVLVEGSVFGPRLMQALILGDSCPSCGNTSVRDVTIRNSLLHNTTAQALMMKNPREDQWPSNWHIEHSTIYGAGGSNVVLQGGSGHVLRASIFVQGSLTIRADLTTEDNCQWNTTKAEVGTTADPGFVDPLGGGNRQWANFALRAGSPCTGKGASITSAQQLLRRPE